MDPVSRNIFADVFKRLAETADSPADALGDLKNALRLNPDDEDLARRVAALTEHLSQGPTYVAIEKVRAIGPMSGPIEGRLYVLEPDGRLKPADGEDLRRAEDTYPGFARNWRLGED